METKPKTQVKIVFRFAHPDGHEEILETIINASLQKLQVEATRGWMGWKGYTELSLEITEIKD